MASLKRIVKKSFLRDFVIFLLVALLFEARLASYFDNSPAGDVIPPSVESLASDEEEHGELLSSVYVPLDYGLVAYWDGSGSNGKSYDISGHSYTAALGGTAFQSEANALNGVYFKSTPASAQSDGTWTKSDDSVFDAVGDGNKAFTFSFWYVTSSAEEEDQLVNFVGANYSDITHSPFIIMSGDYNGGTWFWRGYDLIGHRNNINMTPYADGKWHNIILTENKKGAYGYIDGKSVGPSPLYTGNFSYSTGWNLTFGCRQALQDNNTQCAPLEFYPNYGYVSDLGIDEIAFWKRSFTVNDVAMLYYNGTNGTFCKGNPCSFSRNKFK